MLTFILLMACSPDDGDDTDADALIPIADLTTPSSGECPDLSAGSGTVEFESSGEDRTVTVLLPEGGAEGAPVVFFFHGLMSPDYTPEPTEYMADALRLQQIADDEGVVIVLPEARTMTMYTYTFFMWDIFEEDDRDLVLFDDLRSCLADEQGVDLTRLPVLGFSGGALFTTTMMRERGDAISAAVEMSGGADLDAELLPAFGARYDTPAWQLPVLMWAGGDQDVWPDASLAVVDFPAATDALQAHLAVDGSLAVRCDHDRGHTLTNSEFASAQTWALSHVFGEPSPYAQGGIEDLDESCFYVQ